LRLATGILGHIRHDEEWAARMDPTRGFQNGAGLAIGLVQLVVPAVGVGLENPRIVGEVGLRMLAGSIPRVVEHRRRLRRAAERAIVAHIDPTPPGDGLALGQDRLPCAAAPTLFLCLKSGRRRCRLPDKGRRVSIEIMFLKI
jgi:hypothetical protein